MSHFCVIWRHWSENTSQLIPFCLTTTSIISEIRSLKNFYWLLHRPWCWLRLQPKMQTPAGVHSGNPAPWPSLLQAEPKEMVRAEPTNNFIAGIDTNHSIMFTLLPEINVICVQRWIQFELQNSPSRFFAFDGKIHYRHLANLWNRITTKIFDIFIILYSH